MATKKQRRRRAKEQRHDYVWVDDEGNELEPDEARPAEKRRQARARRRLERDPQAPSWQRTLQAGSDLRADHVRHRLPALARTSRSTTKITQTLLIVAIFVPFSYFIDRFFYRSCQRRRRAARQSDGRRGS